MVAAGAPTSATVVLNGVGSAKVTVLKAEGPPAVGATVTIDSSAGFPDPDPATTNGFGRGRSSPRCSRGRFGEGGVPGPRGVRACPGAPDGGHRDFAITLAPSARLAGPSETRAAQPVVGATVLLTGPRTESTTRGPAAPSSSPRCRSAPSPVRPRPRTGTRAARRACSPANPPPVVITLAGFGDLTVVVRDADDAPVAGAWVDATSVRLGPIGSRTTDAQGRAAFPHARAGEIDLAVWASGLRASRRVTLPAGGSLTETIVLGARGSVSGTVREPGSDEGLEGVQIEVGTQSTVTGPGGVYTVGDLVPARTRSRPASTGASGPRGRSRCAPARRPTDPSSWRASARSAGSCGTWGRSSRVLP